MPLTEREKELLGLLNSYLNHLGQLLDTDPAAVEPFGPVDAAFQRWLQLAVQCCIDLGDSLMAKRGLREPRRSRDIFGALVGAGFLNSESARILEHLTDFRNILDHAHASLPPQQTWQRAREGLPALAEFARRMSQNS